MPSTAKPRTIKLVWLLSLANVSTLVISLILFGATLRGQISGQLRVWTQRQLLFTTISALNISPDADEPPSRHLAPPALPSLTLKEKMTSEDIISALQEANLSSRLLDAQGHTLAQSHRRPHHPPAGRGKRRTPQWQMVPLPTQEQLVAVTDSQTSLTWISAHNGREHFNVLIPLTNPDGSKRYLQLYSSWRLAQGVIQGLNTLLWLIGLVAACIGTVLSVVLSRFLTRDMASLAHTANQVAEGDMSARTALTTRQKELHDVAKAFDHMVSELEQAFITQKRFVADASHELKTPLTAISGMAEMLEDATPEEATRALKAMNREIERMRSLIEDLLLLSRSESACSGTESTSNVIDLAVPLRDALQCVETADRAALGPEQAHHFEVDIPAQLPAVSLSLNAAQVSRVLRNVLENAQKYAPPATNVEVGARVRHDKNAVELVVRDHGPGIPEANLPRVFERFYRADPSRNRKTGGSGLGLAIVKSLMEKCGGQAAVRNHPEKGLEVTLTFPRHEQ